jgi:nitrogen PTS system EIIA component
MPHRVICAREVAEMLRITPEEVERRAREGELPCEPSGGRVVFRRNAIETWASEHILKSGAGRLRELHPSGADIGEDPGVAGLLAAGAILPRLDARTKPSVLRALLAAAEATGRVNDPAALRESVEARERLCSTALPGGVAVPHPLHHAPYQFEGSFIILARTAQRVPFGAPDGLTTDLFWLLCCDDERAHLRWLARVCMLCHHTSLLVELRELDEAADMQAAVTRAELDLASG